ncbi:MAG: recombinase family protein [Firmicutes bacterium]|nr:recombinase family protein [Bacillota bacterium]
MNAVIYARYSSDGQREESIEGQLRVCQEYAEKNDIQIIGTYIDRAYSGRNDDRPEFQKMIRDSKNGQFEILLLYKLDRFARNREDSVLNKIILRKNNVRVLSVTENISDKPEGILLESLLEGMAEYYSAELSEKVLRGMTENALKGKYNGGTIPLGYVIDDDKNYIINPFTAPIVQEIYTRYADGETVTEITNSLNVRGLKSSTGSEFNKSSLHHILKNRRYIGEYHYNGIIHPDSIPPIVSQELFDKVQERNARNKKAPAMKKAKADYILTTKLFCGKCGALMVGESGTGYSGNTHHYYKCANAKKYRSCKKKSVKKDYIEHLVVAETKSFIFKKKVIEHLADLLVDLQHKENTVLPLLQKQMRDIEKRIKNIITAIEQGIITSSTKKRLDELEVQKTDLEISIAQEKIEKPIITKEQIIFWISQFKEGNIDDPQYRKNIVDIFVNSIYLYDDKVLITFNYKDGTKNITLEEINSSDLEANGSPNLFKGER